MMWITVVPKIIARLKADAELIESLGGEHIYRNRSGTGPAQIPGIYWFVVDEQVGENTSEVILQWDIWAHDMATMAKIEQRMYRLMHRDLPVTVDGLKLWMRYHESGDLFNNRADIPEPEQGVLHKAVDYLYIPARDDARTALFD